MTRANWDGALELGDGWAVWRGAVGDGVMHRHFAAQAVLADAPVSVIDHDGNRAAARCLLIDPLVPHRLLPAPRAMLVYVESARRLDAALAALLAPARQASSRLIIAAPGARGFWSDWLSRGDREIGAVSLRLAGVLHWIDGHLQHDLVPLAAAARVCGLSPDRFRHLFAAEVGLPYSRYVRWRRLRLAAAELNAGRDATTAAHTAGFADAAHFARTLKTTFGITAGQALLHRR